ncbi:thiamine-phosphate kinase [Tuwongella immobilis]|uniref:Thiamine-monophosphate kinase n=1 Tax=Tuwongella immobilis TaxID=692036 RepID=A0A6C2YQY9_9BACT|nr:thiamine-phosphate kinase [Tuwongella immobilis]VIP03405.1 thiamine-monophosphate kinase : Thiamine-monophosphate kinase OS=Planctomyces maris DSM 8797 GN=thiL PE=3 SV=1: AIRS: AIRS_C [Tuwongella immobilis]VTS04182.1 thiamine-monophosphate kinase : Thiamine-monophosphate kinase OS=Planctomyces maris DSM 8797 GN=thiL PE=3 SV=1: AIRS: AIRS_C [Tuwongella immobilis]
MSEFAWIDWLRERTPSVDRVRIGPGDDTAAMEFPGDRLTLVTTDMLLEGSCFRLAEAGAFRVGRKAMSVNLSDIAAMAGVPVAAVVSVGLPRSGGRAIAEDLYRGMREVADRFGVAIIGGDTNSWTGELVISVTVLGEANPRGPVRRSGAKPGDWLCVTGRLGGSILGHHLDFTPRVREALWLSECVDLHAMIDLSDGMSSDVHHLARESRCGFVLNAAQIPIHASAERLAEQDGKSQLEHALCDGEDFELLFTVSPEDGRKLIDAQPVTGLSISQVGIAVAESGVWLDEAGTRRPLPAGGYVHAFD